MLTEHAPDLGAKLDEWYGFYRPGSPGERDLIDIAVMSRIERRRVGACLTEMVNREINTAIFNFDCDQEDAMARYQEMLPTRPGAAVIGLKRDAPAHDS